MGNKDRAREGLNPGNGIGMMAVLHVREGGEECTHGNMEGAIPDTRLRKTVGIALGFLFFTG